MAKEGQELGLPTAGGGTEGGGYGGNTDVYYTEAKYSCAIYCDAADYGPMRVGHPEARIAGVLEVVGAGGNRPGGSEETGNGIRKISETESEEEDSNREPTGAKGGGKEESQGVSGSSEAEWSGAEDD